MMNKYLIVLIILKADVQVIEMAGVKEFITLANFYLK